MAGRGILIPVSELNHAALRYLKADGYGALIQIRLLLWEAPGNSIPHDPETIAYQLRCSKELIEHTIKVCTDPQFELLIIRKNKLSSPLVTADSERLQKKINNLKQMTPNRCSDSEIPFGSPNECNVMICSDPVLDPKKEDPKDPETPKPRTKKPTEPQLERAPGIKLSDTSLARLVEAFGAESTDWHIQATSDWATSKGKLIKNSEAQIRNIIRKNIAEQTGFYHPNAVRSRQQKKLDLREWAKTNNN